MVIAMVQKRKILVVDDEEGFTDMVKLTLEATGRFEVRIENQGAEALNAALQYKPDLILLDVIMPDLEGPDVLVELKSHKNAKDIPVVFLTATVRKDEVDAQGGGDIAGHAFLAKPSTLDELVTCINRHLD